MKKKIVGIDVSKDKLDFCILDPQTHQVLTKGVLSNTRKDITKWLKDFSCIDFIFALEHTGHYGAMFASLLSERDYDYYMITPYDLKRSLGIQRGKTDAVDAYRIASYTASNKYRLKFYRLPTEVLRKVKALMSARDRMVKMSVQLQNSVKSNQILGRTIDLKDLIREEKKQIKSIKTSIRKLEQQMQDLIRGEEVLSKSYRKITQVIGVGPITAIKCIVETNNFLNFENARKFSCYSGLAPFPYQSGSSVKGKTKTHFLRNKQLKSVLYKAAASARQHDPQLRSYYRRKTEEGKHKLSVLNAIANKIVLRIFAVISREEPFVKLAA